MTFSCNLYLYLYHQLDLLPEGLRFSYDDPHLWQNSYPQCGGAYQSPIPLSTHKAIPIGLPPLHFGHYEQPFDELLSVRNNGHTGMWARPGRYLPYSWISLICCAVEFKVPATVLGERPYVTGGLLGDFYEAMAVHFHWGSPQRKGSEHVLNGRRYDLEMHIVHRNTRYQSDEEASNQTDGLAVLAVLFKVVRVSEKA